MLIFACDVLIYLGANKTLNTNDIYDPTTEEEFQKLEFTSPTPITWADYQTALPLVQAKVAIKQIRIYRDKLLAKSDWIMTYDNIESLANKDDWISYRQALRDAPENITEYVWKS